MPVIVSVVRGTNNLEAVLCHTYGRLRAFSWPGSWARTGLGHERVRGVRCVSSGLGPLVLGNGYGNLGCMKIVVCIKHVPDVQSDRRMEDGFLVRGEEDVLNELDENAVEAAVSLVEELGGEVVTLTMGPEDAEDGLRRALQMGADSGVLVSDESLAGADVVATARTLAAAIARIGGVDPASPREEDQAATGDVDLVITGMASLDSMTSMLPGALAAALGVPALTLASALEASDDGEVLVTRATGTLREVLAAPTPALVSVTDQANEPRYPNFAAMRAAKKKPVDTWDLAELGLEAGAGPAIAVVDSEARPAREAGIIRTDAGEAGRDLAAWLVDNKLV